MQNCKISYFFLIDSTNSLNVKSQYFTVSKLRSSSIIMAYSESEVSNHFFIVLRCEIVAPSSESDKDIEDLSKTKSSQFVFTPSTASIIVYSDKPLLFNSFSICSRLSVLDFRLITYIGLKPSNLFKPVCSDMFYLYIRSKICFATALFP